MHGYVAQRRDRYYAVIYEGRDPVTGKERRRWHPAGTYRAEAERLAAKLAKAETAKVDAVRALTFGAYLTSQWLPAKRLQLATSTYRGYERNVQLHILPTLGRTSLRRLRFQQIESLHDSLLHPRRRTGPRPEERVRGAPHHPECARGCLPPRTGHPRRHVRAGHDPQAPTPTRRAVGQRHLALREGHDDG